MEITIVNETDRLFEFYGTVEEIDAQGDLLPIDQLRAVLPVFMDRGSPITLIHSGQVVGKVLSYEFVETDQQKRAVKMLGKIFDKYTLDDIAWEAVKNYDKPGGATGMSWMGWSDEQFNSETGVNELTGVEITSWGIVLGMKANGSPILPVNRSSKILSANIAAKADTNDYAGHLVAFIDGKPQRFHLIAKSDQEGSTVGNTKTKAMDTEERPKVEAKQEAPNTPSQDFISREEFVTTISGLESKINSLSEKVASGTEGNKDNRGTAEGNNENPTTPGGGGPGPGVSVRPAGPHSPVADVAPVMDSQPVQELDEAKPRGRALVRSDVEAIVKEAIGNSMQPVIEAAVAKAIAKAETNDGNRTATTPRPNQRSKAGMEDEIPITSEEHPEFAVNLALGVIKETARGRYEEAQ